MNMRAKKPRKEGTATPFPAVQDDTLQHATTIPQHTVDEVPPTVQEAISSDGQPLDTDTQAFMESRFGHDFSQVRVHMDERAAESAQAVNAMAYTVGRDMVFGEREYTPETNKGQELIAHELTHVVQQDKAVHSQQPQIQLSPNSFEHEANAMAKIILSEDHSTIHMTSTGSQVLQMQHAPGGGATPGTGKGVDIIFIFNIKDPDQPNLMPDMIAYVSTELGQKPEVVYYLDDIFDHLSKLSELKIKVRRIRIVAHGSKMGQVKMASKEEKMTPKEEQEGRWVSPEEVKAYAERADIQKLIEDVMTPDAVVEFWGCYLGGVKEAGEAWSSAFQSTFKATTATFAPQVYYYYNPTTEQKLEEEKVPKGELEAYRRNHRFKHSSKVKENLQQDFRKNLLRWYRELVQNGDIAQVVGGEVKQVEFMRRLFDRSEGYILGIAVEVEDATRGGRSRQPEVGEEEKVKVVRPGARKEWKSLWQPFSPIKIGKSKHSRGKI